MAKARIAILTLSTLTALFSATGAISAPAVPAVSQSVPAIRACNDEFRANAFTQGFVAARGLYSECLSSNHTPVLPVKAKAEHSDTLSNLHAASDKKSCHSFSIGSFGAAPTRVCLTTALVN